MTQPQKIEISGFTSDDGSKQAIVSLEQDKYLLDFYENKEYTHTIFYKSKSLRFVEDAAENYVNGIFLNFRDFKEV